MNIVVLDPIHPDGVALLQAAQGVRLITWDMPEAKNWQRHAEGLIVRGSVVPGEAIRGASALRVIGRHGAGYDKVDIAAAKEKGVALLTTPFENTYSVAELAVTLMLAATRNVPAAHTAVCNEGWQQARSGLGGSELAGHAVGFVGFGRIARTVATMLRAGFHTPLFAYDPMMPPEAWDALDMPVTRCATLGELFAHCDFISVHVPKTKETMGMIGREALAGARPSLVLVNTARGGVIDEDALAEALSSGRIRAAASDVFVQEPPRPDHPLLRLPNFIATPHYGGSTSDSLQRVGVAVARETLAFLQGGGDPAYRVI